MSAFFTGLAMACGVVVAGLIFSTFLIVTNSGPTSWMAAAIVAWITIGFLALGALFGIAAFSIDESRK